MDVDLVSDPMGTLIQSAIWSSSYNYPKLNIPNPAIKFKQDLCMIPPTAILYHLAAKIETFTRLMEDITLAVH